MIAPKKTKYKSTFIRYNRGVANNGIDIEHGEVALVSLENTFMTPNQIEAARRVISNSTKRAGKVWIRVFPDQAMTQKAANVRMGSGKGPTTKYVAPVRSGKIIIEIGGLDRDLAITALTKASKKLGLKTKIIEKE